MLGAVQQNGSPVLRIVAGMHYSCRHVLAAVLAVDINHASERLHQRAYCGTKKTANQFRAW